MKRFLPWCLMAAAYVVPPVWAYFAIARYVAAHHAVYGPGPICGNPAFALTMLAGIASGSLSLLATGLRGWSVSWWRGTSPWFTVAELTAFTLPAIAGGSFVVSFFCP